MLLNVLEIIIILGIFTLITIEVIKYFAPSTYDDLHKRLSELEKIVYSFPSGKDKNQQ